MIRFLDKTMQELENPGLQNDFEKVDFYRFLLKKCFFYDFSNDFTLKKMFEFLEENLNIMALDQTKKNRLEQEEINLLAAMIDSKVPITAPDFDAYRKEKKPNNPKLQQNMPLEGNNPSEFSKREEVLYSFN